MDMTFTKRWPSYTKSLDALLAARERDPKDEFVLSGTGAKFSITFELAWKVLKDVLVTQLDITDFVTGSPKATLKTAFAAHLISNQDIWLSMLRVRNLLAHDYDNDFIKAEFDNIIGPYSEEFLALKDRLTAL